MDFSQSIDQHKNALSRRISLACQYIKTIQEIVNCGSDDAHKLEVISFIADLMNHDDDNKPMDVCLYVRASLEFDSILPDLAVLRYKAHIDKG